MNILGWIKTGITLFLVFLTPQITIKEDRIEIDLEIENLLTDEMQELVSHGMKLEYELYYSLQARGLHAEIKDKLIVKRLTRKLEYSFLDEVFKLYEDGRMIFSNQDLKKIIDLGKKYRALTFYLNTSSYKEFSFFAQIKLLKNNILEDQLNIQTEDLWLGYAPSVEYNFTHQ